MKFQLAKVAVEGKCIPGMEGSPYGEFLDFIDRDSAIATARAACANLGCDDIQVTEVDPQMPESRWVHGFQAGVCIIGFAVMSDDEF